MKKSEKNWKRRLKTENCSINVKALGVENPLTHSGSRTVNRQDFPIFTRQNHCILILGLQGVRFRKDRSMSVCMFSTPCKPFFVPVEKARKRITQILTHRGASNDLPTLQPDSNPGSRRVSGHSIHPQTAADAPSDRGRSRMAFPRINGESAEARCASGHKIYRGVSHQRNRKHSVNLPYEMVKGARR